MDYCRVVGPRGLCRPLDKKQGLPTNTSPLAPCEGCSKPGKERLFAFQGQETGQGRQVGGVACSDPPRRSLQIVLKRLWPLIGGVAPSDRPRRPWVPGICQPGAPELLAGPPKLP